MQKRLAVGLISLFLGFAGWTGFHDANATREPAHSPFSATRNLPSTGNNANLPHNESLDLPIVARVVDGDTIVVLINGVSEKIRLIGVNTPETVDPRKPVQCFGKEASAFTKSLLLNKTVRLETDPSQDDRDKYGRLLRYVFLADGILVNKEIIALGYGHEYTYRVPYKYQNDFKNAERTARENKIGLWADSACNTQSAK